MTVILRIVGDIHEHLTDAVGPQLDSIASDIERDAKRLVPVDTGDLRSTITVVREGDTITGTAGDIGRGIDYAAHVEFGTRRTLPNGTVVATPIQPYMRPSFRQNRQGR